MYTLFVIPVSYITKLFITAALSRLNYVSKTSKKHSFEHEDVAHENKSNNKSVKKEKEPRDNARKNRLKKKYRVYVKHRPDRRHVFLKQLWTKIKRSMLLDYRRISRSRFEEIIEKWLVKFEVARNKINVKRRTGSSESERGARACTRAHSKFLRKYSVERIRSTNLAACSS